MVEENKSPSLPDIDLDALRRFNLLRGLSGPTPLPGYVPDMPDRRSTAEKVWADVKEVPGDILRGGNVAFQSLLKTAGMVPKGGIYEKVKLPTKEQVLEAGGPFATGGYAPPPDPTVTISEGATPAVSTPLRSSVSPGIDSPMPEDRSRRSLVEMMTGTPWEISNPLQPVISYLTGTEPLPSPWREPTQREIQERIAKQGLQPKGITGAVLGAIVTGGLSAPPITLEEMQSDPFMVVFAFVPGMVPIPKNLGQIMSVGAGGVAAGAARGLGGATPLTVEQLALRGIRSRTIYPTQPLGSQARLQTQRPVGYQGLDITPAPPLPQKGPLALGGGPGPQLALGPGVKARVVSSPEAVAWLAGARDPARRALPPYKVDRTKTIPLGKGMYTVETDTIGNAAKVLADVEAALLLARKGRPRNAAAKEAKRVRVDEAQEEVDAARDFLNNTLKADLPPSELDRLTALTEQGYTLSGDIALLKEVGAAGGKIVKPPKGHPAAGLSTARLRQLAKDERRNPYVADWYADLDPAIISSVRKMGLGKGTSRTIKDTQRDLDEVLEQISEIESGRTAPPKVVLTEGAEAIEELPLIEQVLTGNKIPFGGYTGPRPAPGGGAQMITPGYWASNILGIRSVQVGLTRIQELKNLARRIAGKVFGPMVEDNPLATPAMMERERVQQVIASQATRFADSNNASIRKAFKDLDSQGRIPSLIGVDTTLPGAPTIADIAARLRRFRGSLTKPQLEAMEKLRKDMEPFEALLRELGEGTTSFRPDVMEGGFYIPRGRAALEGAEQPIGRIGGRRRGGKTSSEQPAIFESQSAGIEAKYEYAALKDVLNGYVNDVGGRAINAHITNFFKNLKDSTGIVIGETPKTRMLNQNPDILRMHESLVKTVSRLRALVGRLNERQGRVIDRFLNDPLFDDIDELADALRKGGTVGRGGRYRSANAGASLANVRAVLQSVRQQVDDMKPAWKQALKRAQSPRRNQSMINLPGLNNRSFPDEIAAAANKMLVEDAPRSQSILEIFTNPTGTLQGINNTWRAMRSTMDNSFIGIHMLLSWYAKPSAALPAARASFLAFGKNGDLILGKFINQFDEMATAAKRLTSDQWAARTLRLGGADTEYQLGRGSGSRIARLPVVRQANRAFGFAGDTLRLGWADDMLANEMKSGRSLDDIMRSGDLDRIAEIVNNMTGWSKNRTFGSLGDMLMFAPRFFQSRLNTLTKAALGLRPGAALDQRMARNSMIRMIGGGTLLTLAANEMLGQETDIRPFVNGKKNPNFMKVAYAGRDWSFFGTWDSLLSAFMAVGTGDADRAYRALSSGLVSMGWDLISGEDFIGRRVRDTWEEFGLWTLQSMSPFAAQEAVPSAKDIVGGAIEGDPARIGRGALTMVGEIAGTKSAPFSRADVRNIVSMEMYQGRKWDQINRVQRAAVDADPRIQEFGEFRTDFGTIRQRVSNSFALQKGEKDRLQSELRDKIDAGMKGRDLVHAIQSFKAAVFEAGQTVFNDPEIDVYLKDKPKQSEDAWADLYWSAELSQNLETGTFNYRLRDKNRATILRDAVANGVSRNFILVESRSLRFDDPVVRATIENYEASVADLRPYWEVLEDSFEEDSPYLKIWKQLEEMPKGAERDNFAAQNQGILVSLRRIQNAKRKSLRMRDKNIDDLLIEWRGLDPAHPTNVVERYRERFALLAESR